MPHSSSSDEVVRQAREKRQQQILDCSRRAAKKILAKMKSGRPTETTVTELIAGEFEELAR
jgi:vacuolar-type H+-ATPase subunit H